MPTLCKFVYQNILCGVMNLQQPVKEDIFVSHCKFCSNLEWSLFLSVICPSQLWHPISIWSTQSIKLWQSRWLTWDPPGWTLLTLSFFPPKFFSGLNLENIDSLFQLDSEQKNIFLYQVMAITLADLGSTWLDPAVAFFPLPWRHLSCHCCAPCYHCCCSSRV